MKKTTAFIGQVPEKFSQQRRVPKLPLIVIAVLIGLGGAYALINSLAATPQSTNCFAVPSACGYPDATNTGVPAGTTLTPSGSITVSTPGQVIDGKDVTGTIVVNASNVTIENTRVTQNTTCGTSSACGNYAIGVAAGASNLTIKNVETRTASGQTCEQDVRSGGSNLTIENSYLHACDGNLYAVAPATLKDSYALAKIDIPSDHIENIYMSDTTVTVDHSTLFNPVSQTAVIFGNVNGGQGGTCANHITATNSFLVGGGYTVYGCAHGTGAGSSSVSITGSRFARCLGTETTNPSGGNHICKEGADSHGYYPNGGSYGLATAMYSGVTTWSGNVLDDTGQTVCADGSNGCAGSGGGSTTPPADTTAPTVSITAPANGSSVSGANVTVSASASDNTGVAGVQFKLDGNNLGSEDTSSPYSTTWNTTGATNGSHTLTAVARDAAGNTKTSASVTVTVNNTTGGGGATQSTKCFSKPSACGYPDATNTGVPAGTTLTSSGSITASTNGQVIQGKDITGELVVNAPNVTLKNSKVHTNSGGSGETAIILNQGATNFTIENSEIYGNGSKTNAPESGVWNHYGNAGFKVVRSYIHGSPDNIEGPVDVEDSYLIVDAEYNGAHSENIYLCGAAATVNNSTMYNQSDETSLIFGDGICGSGNPVSVTNSLLAGGGWMLQPDSKGVSAPVTITNNRVGRCLGSVSQDSGGGYVCKGGADGNGYWPYGGHYGLATDLGKLTWSGNVWDDNSQAICPTQDGTGSNCGAGSGGSTGGGSGSDTTKPTVSIAAPANGSTVSGIVTSTATASDDVGVTKVGFYLDNASTPAISDTSSPYNYSFDSKTLKNGSHTITAKAYDAAGNSSTASTTFTVNNADTTPPSSPGSVKATASSATSVNLGWNASTDSGPNATGVAKYNVLRNGAVIAQVTTTSYTDTSVVASTAYSYVIQAIDGAGNVSANSNTASVTTPAATGGGGSSGGAQTTNCFSKPSACGYPDATNTGVPAGTTLTPSGSITASTAGQVISGKDVTGTINITANNVTIQNTRVTSTSTCGPTNACGNYEIIVQPGLTGVVIKNVELRIASGNTCEHDIRNLGATIQVIGSYLHGCDSNLYSVGNTTFTDDYGLSKIDISNDHIENIYFSDSTLAVNHSTLFNPVDQTAVIFGNVNGGQGGTCSNHLSVNNSFLVGGGYTFYPCGNGSSAGSSSVSITNNHLARCLTSEVMSSSGGHHLCKGGTDANGYYPNDGSYGIAAYYFSQGMTWSGNVWDDNGQSVCADGSNGCAGSSTGSSGGSAPDTTKPTTPSSLKATAANSTQVNLTWNASTDSGGSGLAGYNIYRDGDKLNTAPLANATYQDVKVSPSTTYQYAVQAVDVAGNTSNKTGTVSVTTPAEPTTGGSSDLLLGSKDVQKNLDNDVAGSPEAFKYTASASGPAATLNLYIDRGSAASTVVTGLYSDDNGKPGTLLATGSINSPASAAWNTITLSSKPAITGGTTYWIALLGLGGTINFRDASSGNCSQSPRDGSLSQLPATWNTGQRWSTCTLSAYVSSSAASSDNGAGNNSGSSGAGGSSSSGGTPSGPTAPVSITVVGHHHRPVSGATVTIGGQTARTDRHGVATFTGVPVGKQRVAIQADRKTVTKSVRVTTPRSSSRHGNGTQRVTLSLANTNLSLALLLIPVAALAVGGLAIFRPWNSRLSRAAGGAKLEESVVSSNHPYTDTTKPGRKLENPGTVYRPDGKDDSSKQ
jgi:hypothetical protein